MDETGRFYNMMTGEWSDHDPDDGLGFWLDYTPVVLADVDTPVRVIDLRKEK